MLEQLEKVMVVFSEAGKRSQVVIGGERKPIPHAVVRAMIVLRRLKHSESPSSLAVMTGVHQKPMSKALKDFVEGTGGRVNQNESQTQNEPRYVLTELGEEHADRLANDALALLTPVATTLEWLRNRRDASETA